MMLHPDDILRWHNSRGAYLAELFRIASRARSCGGWRRLSVGGVLLPGLGRRRLNRALAGS
jgi:hypothetical protein